MSDAQYKISIDAGQAQQIVRQLAAAFAELNAKAKAPTIDTIPALAALAKLNGAVVSATAALAGLGVAFAKAMSANAAAENAQLGIKSLVAALTDVRNANGEAATGAERLQIAGEVAADQLQKLRLAGMQTSATFEQLAGAFQQAVGAGSSAGLGLDQIRELVVGITQAAGALGMPLDQLNQEVRSLLSGDITSDSTVAKAIGISGEQVKLWRESGQLFEKLNERLTQFKAIGPEAAATWTATLSNIGDALEASLRKMSGGAFDGVKKALQNGFAEAVNGTTGKTTAAFQGIEAAGTAAFDAIGRIAVDAIQGGVEAVKALSQFITENSVAFSQIGDAISAIYDNARAIIVGILKTVGAVIGLSGEWESQTGLVKTALQTVAGVLAMIRDGFSLLRAGVSEVGAAILDRIGGPLRTVLSNLRDFVARIPGIGADLAAGIDRFTRALPTDGSQLRADAAAIRADFEARRTAVNATLASFRTDGQIARDNLRKTENAYRASQASLGGKALAKPVAAADDKKAADAARKKAEAEAEAMRAAKQTYAVAELEAARKRAAAEQQTAEVELQRGLERQLITYSAFLEAKAAADERARQAELEAALLARKQLQENILAEKDPAKRVKLEADAVKLDADIAAIEERRLTIEAQVKLEQERFQRDVESLRVDITANLLDSEGQPLEAALLRLQKKTADLLKDKRVAGNAELEAMVLRQSEREAGKIRQDEETRKAGIRVAQGTAEEARIRAEVAAGQKGELQAEREIRDARLATAAAMRTQVEAAEQLAAKSNDPVQINAARQLRQTYAELASTVDETAAKINDSIYGGIGGLFDTLATNAKGVGDYLKKWASDVLRTVSSILVKSGIESIMGAAGGKSGGLGGIIAGGIRSLLGFAGGGHVRGPGTGTSDSILAKLSNGEFVIKAAAVQALGIDRLHYMNRTGRIPAFATGGLVGAVGGGSTTVQNSLAFRPTVQITSGQMLDAVAGDSAWERWAVNVINNNRSRLNLK